MSTVVYQDLPGVFPHVCLRSWLLYIWCAHRRLCPEGDSWMSAARFAASGSCHQQRDGCTAEWAQWATTRTRTTGKMHFRRILLVFKILRFYSYFGMFVGKEIVWSFITFCLDVLGEFNQWNAIITLGNGGNQREANRIKSWLNIHKPVCL